MLEALLLAVDREMRRIHADNPFATAQEGTGPPADFLFQRAPAYLQDPTSCAAAVRNPNNPIHCLQILGFGSEHAAGANLSMNLPQVATMPHSFEGFVVRNAPEQKQSSSQSSDDNSSGSSDTTQTMQGSYSSSQRVCRPVACRPTPSGRFPLTLGERAPPPTEEEVEVTQRPFKRSESHTPSFSSPAPQASPAKKRPKREGEQALCTWWCQMPFTCMI
jgi:hypothetical protein